MKLKLISLSLILTSSAYGITLNEALKTALERNNLLLAKRYELKEKESDLKISKLHLLPKVDLFSKYNKTTDAPYAIMNRMEVQKLDMMGTNFNDPGKSQVFETGVKTTLPIWLGGKLRIAVDLNKKEVKATKKQLKRDTEKVVFDVVRAYYNVLAARSFVETAQLAVKDAENHVKDAEVVYKAGLGLKSDYLRAKVYLEQAEENLVKAKSNYEIAKSALNVAMGLPPSHRITVDGDLTYRNFQFNLNKLAETALKNRQELKELKVRLSQAKDMERLAKSDFLPNVGAFGEYFTADDRAPWKKQNSSWVFGVQASLNLFNGGIKFEKLRKARISQLKVKEYLERAEKGVEFEVSRAYFRFQEAKKRVELAETSIKEAEESLRIVEKRYRNGLSNITELLDTQTALNRARSNYVAALSAYRQAVAAVYYSEGVLFENYSKLTD